jgi:hypothetical protein
VDVLLPKLLNNLHDLTIYGPEYVCWEAVAQSCRHLSFCPQPQIPLQSLDVGYIDVDHNDAFAELLNFATHLRFLSVGAGCDFRELNLAPNAMPNLEAYNGPARCCPVILAGRPVASVTLCGTGQYSWWPNTVAALGQITVPIRTLRLGMDRRTESWSLSYFDCLLSHFPKLAHFEVTCRKNPEEVRQFVLLS